MSHLISPGTGTPPEPPEGTVVRVTLNFGGATDYTYVWYRAVTGAWYVTGQSGERAWRDIWRTLEGVRLVDAIELETGRVLTW